MKLRFRSVAAVAAGVLATTALVVSPAGADDGTAPPRHSHMLVLGVVYEGENPVGFRKCIDIANAQVKPNHVHHMRFHVGKAGDALRAAGHSPVPGAPLTPWANCAALEAYFGR